MPEALLQAVQQSITALPSQPNVRRLEPEEARLLAEGFGTHTELGNFNYVSTVKNLSTALTVYIGREGFQSDVATQKKKDIRKSAPQTVQALHAYLQKAPLVQLDATMGRDSEFTPACRLFVSTYRKDSVRLAHMVGQTLFPEVEGQEPGLTAVMIPEWQEKDRQVLVFPEIGVTYILGTDYYGEAKNAFLRMAMWQAKQQGMLGLHAGTKVLHAAGPSGLRKLGMIMFGIAATGKTTHSCHDHGLDGPGEGVEIVQDDVVFWRTDGSAAGSERALYIKTENLDPDSQPLLYSAAIEKNTILENVMVDTDGRVFFEDRTLTANGHAIAQRCSLGMRGSSSPNLPPVSELDGLIIAFMVRSYTVSPIAARLTPEQAAVAFMLSESIDAAGSDQQPAGQTGGIGSSPFVIGDASDDCNRFYELLKAHEDKIECYMLNTGGVGEIVEHGLDGARRVRQKVTRVQIPEMASVIRSIARQTVRWREDPNWMLDTPEHVDGLSIQRFDLARHYEQGKIDFLVAQTRLDRAAYAEQFPHLDPAIRQAVEF